MELTLTELEAATSLGLTWLLTLYLTAVACQETFVLQLLLVFFIDLHQSTGDSEAESLALTCEATTVEVSLDVILLSNIKQVQTRAIELLRRPIALITSIFPYYLYWLISIVFGC